VTRLGAAKVGPFLRQQTEELTRIWRLARASARPEVFPGLIDDLVPNFFDRAGELLATGAAPEEVWRGLAGLVRWATALAPGELTQEWAVLVEVLSATCESVNAEPAIAAWLTRAAAACEAGSVALSGGQGERPERIVIALVFSTLAPRQPRTEKEEETAG